MPLPSSCGSVGQLQGSIIGAFNTLLREHTARLRVVWDQNLSYGFHASSLLVLYCSRLAVLSLDCSLMSSSSFHLDSSSRRTTCGVIAVLIDLYSSIIATSTLLWDYAAMKAVWDHTRSFLRHHADFDCGIMPSLVWLDCWLDSLSHRTTCGITANWNRPLVGRLEASLPTWFVVW
jgi:hypothetical protein